MNSSFKLDFEWLSQDNSPVMEERTTFASFSILINEKNIISFIDSTNKSIRSNLHVSLYPLAEWFALNWWFLFGEKTQHNDYSWRHNLKYTKSGFSFPDLNINFDGNIILLSWSPSKYKFHSIEFISKGIARIDRQAFEIEVGSFIKAVISRLEQFEVKNTILQNEWKVINSASEDETLFCLTTASLGLDAYSIDEREQRLIIEVDKFLPESIRDDFFISADYKQLDKLSKELKAAMTKASNTKAKLESIKNIRDKIDKSKQFDSSNSAWDEGYDAAKKLRKFLGLNGHIIADTKELAHALKTDLSQIKASFSEVELDNNEIKGVMAINKTDQLPGFAFFKTPGFKAINEQHKVFTFCRVLYEYIFSTQLNPALITTLKTHNQKRNRAFAAEFILPADALRKMKIKAEISQDDLENLSTNFNISPYVLKHQLKNHHIAEVIDED
jgi:hypothetical protein